MLARIAPIVDAMYFHSLLGVSPLRHRCSRLFACRRQVKSCPLRLRTGGVRSGQKGIPNSVLQRPDLLDLQLIAVIPQRRRSLRRFKACYRAKRSQMANIHSIKSYYIGRCSNAGWLCQSRSYPLASRVGDRRPRSCALGILGDRCASFHTGQHLRLRPPIN